LHHSDTKPAVLSNSNVIYSPLSLKWNKIVNMTFLVSINGYCLKIIAYWYAFHGTEKSQLKTSGSAMAEEPRDALVGRNSATTKYPYRVALFA